MNQRIDSITLEDPWSNRTTRQKAYAYTQEFYSRLIPSLAKSLNEIHQTNFSEKFWTILCGPWLKLMINSSFHSWELISEAKKNYKSLSTLHIDTKLIDFVAHNTGDFEFLVTSDLFKSSLNYEIINFIGGIKHVKLVSENSQSDNMISIKSNVSALNKNTKLKFKAAISRLNIFTRILNKINKHEVFGIYLSKKYFISTFLKLFSIPRFLSVYQSIDTINVKLDPSRRAKAHLDFNVKNEYEKFFKKIIFQTIPLVFFEGFKDLTILVDSFKLKKNPLSITTSTHHFSDDLFKIYAAVNAEKNSKIKIISHGGFGKFLYSDFMDHEFDICDDYFTWGWSEYSRKCTRGFLTKPVKEVSGKKDNNKFVMILLDSFKHTKFIDSNPNYDEFISSYLPDQINFLNTINREKIENGIIKLGTYKINDFYQNNIELRIKNALPNININFSYREDDFIKIASKARIIVCTYNGSNDIESLRLNRPTIIFWNINKFELIQSAKEKFKKLKSTKIFHDNHESAARHFNKIWDDPYEWWHSKIVQDARKEFLNEFGRYSESPVKEIVSFIKK
jgi:putative transferase (TIGR04331 family)